MKLRDLSGTPDMFAPEAVLVPLVYAEQLEKIVEALTLLATEEAKNYTRQPGVPDRLDSVFQTLEKIAANESTDPVGSALAAETLFELGYWSNSVTGHTTCNVVTTEMTNEASTQPPEIANALLEALGAIEQADTEQKRKVHLHGSFWVYEGCSRTNNYKTACAFLGKHGFQTRFFYEEKQLVDMYTIVEW